MREGKGSVRQTKDGGYLHKPKRHGRALPPMQSVTRQRSKASGPKRVERDWAAVAEKCQAAVAGGRLRALAGELGVSEASLEALGVGWSATDKAWAFPMTRSGGEVSGIRLRTPSGHKFAMKGSREGLFVPTMPKRSHPERTLFIAEGPTDTAALLDLGFNAIGRPSCTGGLTAIVRLVQKRQAQRVVILADADKPGQRGANALASVLGAYVDEVRVVTPPKGIKDVRQWKQKGATRQDVERAIEAEPGRRVTVAAKRAGRVNNERREIQG
jgi:5S rRNA maturation endonuclease (ribonuclease M5)